jgi:hypothetical protein
MASFTPTDILATLKTLAIDEARVAVCYQVKEIVNDSQMREEITKKIKEGVDSIVKDALTAAKAAAEAETEANAAVEVEADADTKPTKEGHDARADKNKTGGNSIQSMSGGLTSAPFAGGRRRRTRRASSRRTRRRHSSKCRKCHRRRSRRRVMKGGNDGGTCGACGGGDPAAFN